MKRMLHQIRAIVWNDSRLIWRNSSLGDRVGLGLIAVFVLLLHIAPIALFRAGQWRPNMQWETIIWSIAVVVMSCASVDAAVRMLYERRDFDLLLASPTSVAAILVAKVISLTATTFFSVLVFALPLIDGAVVLLSPSYLAAFGVWVAVSVVCASVGLSVVLGLIRIVGAATARVISQIWCGASAAAILLLTQFQFWGDGHVTLLTPWISRLLSSTEFTLTARAATAEPPALGMIGMLAMVAATGAVFLLRAELRSSRQLIAANTSAKPRLPHFLWRGGLLAGVLRKEFRLLVRNPYLIRPIFGLFLTILVAGTAMGRFTHMGTLALLALIIEIAGSSILASAVLFQERCWELLWLSACPRSEILLAKLIAATLLPTLSAGALGLAIIADGQFLLTILTASLCLAWVAGPLWFALCSVGFGSNQTQPNWGEGGADGVLLKVFMTGLGAFFCVIGGAGLLLNSTKLNTRSAPLFALVFIVALGCFGLATLKRRSSAGHTR